MEDKTLVANSCCKEPHLNVTQLSFIQKGNMQTSDGFDYHLYKVYKHFQYVKQRGF
jgi:hypothetical protein